MPDIFINNKRITAIQLNSHAVSKAYFYGKQVFGASVLEPTPILPTHKASKLYIEIEEFRKFIGSTSGNTGYLPSDIYSGFTVTIENTIPFAVSPGQESDYIILKKNALGSYLSIGEVHPLAVGNIHLPQVSDNVWKSVDLDDINGIQEIKLKLSKGTTLDNSMLYCDVERMIITAGTDKIEYRVDIAELRNKYPSMDDYLVTWSSPCTLTGVARL